MHTTVTTARIAIAYDDTGALKGGDLVRLITVRDDAGQVVSRSETAPAPIAGTVQGGVDLAPLLGQALADALAANGQLRAERDALLVQITAAQEADAHG